MFDRLQRLEEICKNSDQDENIALLCRAFFKLKNTSNNDPIVTEIGKAISDAILEFPSGPFLDISQLSQSFKQILILNNCTEPSQDFLEISLQLDEIKLVPRYSLYSEERLLRLVNSMKEILPLAADFDGFSSEFFACYQALFDQALINFSLVIRKVMLSLGEEINKALRVIALPAISAQNEEKNGANQEADSETVETVLVPRHEPFFDYYRSRLADSLYEILQEYRIVCPFQEDHAFWRIFEQVQKSHDRYAIYLKIITEFVESHPLREDESGLKRIGVYFLKHYQDKSNYAESDSLSSEKIAKVVAECVVRYSTNDKRYFPGFSLLHALKKIICLHENSPIIANLMSGSFYIPVPDPFDYKDYFVGEYPYNEGMKTLRTFNGDFDRFPPHTVIRGRLLNLEPEIKKKCQNQYRDLVRTSLFNEVNDQNMQNVLIDLFCRHTHQAGLSHLAMVSFSTYLSIKDISPEIIPQIVDEDVRVSFYSIENGYGIVQKNSLVCFRFSDPDRMPIFFGTISMAHELTLNSANPDDVTVRCVGLQCQQDLSQVGVFPVMDEFIAIIEEKTCCIPTWQRMNIDVMLFAYGVAIQEKKDPLGFQLQKLAKDFCAVVRKNYSSLVPNATKVDEMNALCGTIKEIIGAYQQKGYQDLLFRIANFELQLKAFEQSLSSESRLSGSSLTLYLPSNNGNTTQSTAPTSSVHEFTG